MACRPSAGRRRVRHRCCPVRRSACLASMRSASASAWSCSSALSRSTASGFANLPGDQPMMNGSTCSAWTLTPRHCLAGVGDCGAGCRDSESSTGRQVTSAPLACRSPAHRSAGAVARTFVPAPGPARRAQLALPATSIRPPAGQVPLPTISVLPLWVGCAIRRCAAYAGTPTSAVGSTGLLVEVRWVSGSSVCASAVSTPRRRSTRQMSPRDTPARIAAYASLPTGRCAGRVGGCRERYPNARVHCGNPFSALLAGRTLHANLHHRDFMLGDSRLDPSPSAPRSACSDQCHHCST